MQDAALADHLDELEKLADEAARHEGKGEAMPLSALLRQRAHDLRAVSPFWLAHLCSPTDARP